MDPRHRARRLVLQGLCSLDVQGPHALLLVRGFLDDSREAAEVLEAAHELLGDAYADREACDELLARHTRHWDLNRLALVDRNILRLTAYELRADRAPVKVLITEAIRLAREFCTAESPRFVNGILDAVAKELAGGNAPEAEPAKEEDSAGSDEGDAGNGSLK